MGVPSRCQPRALEWNVSVFANHWYWYWHFYKMCHITLTLHVYYLTLISGGGGGEFNRRQVGCQSSDCSSRLSFYILEAWHHKNNVFQTLTKVFFCALTYKTIRTAFPQNKSENLKLRKCRVPTIIVYSGLLQTHTLLVLINNLMEVV